MREFIRDDIILRGSESPMIRDLRCDIIQLRPGDSPNDWIVLDKEEVETLVAYCSAWLQDMDTKPDG